MVDVRWLKRGVTLVFLAIAVALPVSFHLPIFGAPFIFLFSDAILLGMAAFIAGLVPTASGATRFMSLILLWIALSLALEVPHLHERMSDLMGGTNRGIHSSRPNQIKIPPAVVSIMGPANPILAARGRKWEVEPDVHMVGVRQSMGRPLINMATSVDLPDLLWSRGIEPRIGERGFPQLSISNVVSLESSRLKLEYLDAPDQVAATYERKLPLPKIYPGFSMGGTRSLILSVFYFNLWREVLQVNRPVDLNREIDSFLDIAVGTSNRGNALGGPTRAIEIEQEQVVQVPEGQSVSKFFETTNTSYFRSDGGDWRWEVCGKYPTPLEFGGPGNSTYLLGLFRGDSSLPALLHHVSPDDAIFAFYCEPKTHEIIAFSHLGTRTRPVLRVSIFSSDGSLRSIHFFRLSKWQAVGNFIIPGTWTKGSAGSISFQMMGRIPLATADSHGQMDEKQYRLIRFRAD